MDEQLEIRLRFLREAKTEGMPHSNRALLDHLLGTRQLLVEWGARSELCDAGLFHSIYGTEHYELNAVPLELREQVRGVIGEEAESLAWLFCMMKRETFDENLGRAGNFAVQHRVTGESLPLTQGQFDDLVTMTFANTLEAFPRLSWGVRRNCRAYLRSFRAIAIPAAQSAFDKLDAKTWEIWK